MVDYTACTHTSDQRKKYFGQVLLPGCGPSTHAAWNRSRMSFHLFPFDTGHVIIKSDIHESCTLWAQNGHGRGGWHGQARKA